jgi:hypothetical protein
MSLQPHSGPRSVHKYAPPPTYFFPRSYSAAVDTNVTPLTDNERAFITQQLDAAKQFVADYGSSRTMGLEAVEHAWASWLDRQAVDPGDPNPIINAVGVYFGQTLIECMEGFGWVIATDDAGTDLAVFGLPGTGDVLIYPANLVAKRYERREAWFLESGRDEILTRVQDIRG